MWISTASSRLTRGEEAFLRALLWEESHLQPGPATRAASEHGLSLPRTERVFERSERLNFRLSPLTPFAMPHSLRGSQMTKSTHYKVICLEVIFFHQLKILLTKQLGSVFRLFGTNCPAALGE